MNIKRFTSWLILPAFLLGGMTSCIKDDTAVMDCGSTGSASVRLIVRDVAASRAGSTETDNKVRQLRVYAFNQNGNQVGYVNVENMPEGSAYVPMYLSESGPIRFYVIANDKYATIPEGTASPDWENMTGNGLSGLSFDGWQEVDNEIISPMVNDIAGGEGNYNELVNVGQTSNTEWQIVPVTVRHALSRLRLLLNKEGEGDITVLNAKVIHRPDNYVLFTPRSVDVIKFDKNQGSGEDEFVTNIPITTSSSLGSYQEVGRTFLRPNPYGSSDRTGDTYVPAYPSGASGQQGLEYAYILSIDYAVGGSTKHKDVYLPQVPRNKSIDVQGTLKSGSLNLELTVNDWEDGGSFDMDYSNEVSVNIDQPANPRTSDGSAYAVTYSNAAENNHPLRMSLKIEKPVGSTWTINVSNGNAFTVSNADGGPASGVVDGKPVEIVVSSKVPFDTENTTETDIYLTITLNDQSKGEQIINSESEHPGTKTRIKVRLISIDEWNQLTAQEP